jgi:hypothetical protein
MNTMNTYETAPNSLVLPKEAQNVDWMLFIVHVYCS